MKPIKENQTIILKCVGFIFQNIGNSNVIIDGMWTIPPGTPFSVKADPGEYMEQSFIIAFEPLDMAEETVNHLNFLKIING